MEELTEKEIKTVRQGFLDMGAKGVVIKSPTVKEITRTTTPKTGVSLEGQIDGFIASMKHPREADVLAASRDILTQARAVE